MRGAWQELLLPAAAVGLAVAGLWGRSPQTVFSYSAARDIPAEVLRLDTLRTDTLSSLPADTTALPAFPDSAAAPSPADSLEDEGFLFGEQEDTVPAIMARDTMKVPDSLKFTDPFLYRWYVAVKDSLTHRIVVDSLKAEGDSLDWPRIDSLYLDDSTRTAKRKFDEWYASLDRKGRKKYHYEQMLPIKMHRIDSILNRKDSLRKVKDSIIESTPRILETFAVPDSMQYRRLISWKQDRYFGKVRLEEWDTTFNYHFRDYPFQREDIGGSWLGMAGSAVQTYDFFKRRSGTGVSWYDAYDSWTYTPESIPMFNTKTPYTELEYYGTLFATSMKESDNIRIMTTQNILPSLNFTLEYKRYGGEGILQNEATANKTLAATVNWLGKRHLVHAGYIYNKVTRKENGGIVDNRWIRDTTVDAREINVWLSEASNKIKKNTVFLDQSYRIPFSFLKKLGKKHRKAQEAEEEGMPEEESGGETAAKDDDDDVTTAFIGHSSEYSSFSKLYTDAIATTNSSGSEFFGGAFYMNPLKSADSLRVSKLDNRIYFRLQPWAEDGIVSKIEGGVGDRLLSHYMMRSPGDYIKVPRNTVWNSAYVYAGAEGRLKKYISWNALGSYTFLGHDVNDFDIQANAAFSIYPFRRHKDSPMTISARFSTSLKEPDFFQQNFYSNHYRWSNSFSKVSTTVVDGRFSVPRWRLDVDAGYSLLGNYLWYNTSGAPEQASAPVSVFKASLRKDFTVARLLHLDNRVLFQKSSDDSVLPLPLVAVNLRWYIQFNIVSADVMKMQLGADVRYNTPWNAPAFNPVAGVFFAQDKERYGNCPIIDVFANIQWKRACVFVKLENAGMGWPMTRKDYFSAHNYISTTRAVKFGIYWPFYVQSGKKNTLSSKAGSGGGRSGGGGFGGLSGLKSGLGGAMGGF